MVEGTWPVAADVVDADKLVAWMDERSLGSGPLVAPHLLAGGTQNVLLQLERAGRSYVLRRPPPHKRSNSDETMRREAQVLAALAGSDVPHPGLIAAEPDEALMGCAFYLMEPIDGFNPSVGWPPLFQSSPDLVRGTCLSMADAAAALGRVDHVAVGLGSLGKGEGWLERQVPRWRSHLEGYAAFEGYDGPTLPAVLDVGAWLDAHRPTEWRQGIIHGDLHLANVMAHPTEGRLAAVIDWELSTIGDPLLDLGHILATWATATGPEGMPTAQELIDRYAEGSDRDVHAVVRWYHVLACYRLGIILEGTHARACAGMAPKATGDMLHAMATSLLQQAADLVGA